MIERSMNSGLGGVGFFIPVSYCGKARMWSQKLVELVDGYFYLGGKMATVTGYKNHLTGSEEVNLENGAQTDILKTILKVASYITIVLPVGMLVAKSILRSVHIYHLSSSPNLYPFLPEEFVMHAPLTFVRSLRPTQLKISLLFNSLFSPREPTLPRPSRIENLIHTWNILAHTNGTLSVEGCARRVHMLWWESHRKTPSQLNPHRSVCVEKSRIGSFLKASLSKMGLHEREIEGFSEYWEARLKHTYKDSPYVRVQLTDPSEYNKLLPSMTVQADEEKFTLHRLYFLFEPTSDVDSFLDAETYLNQLASKELGSNIIIDLGGEIAKTDAIANEWPNEKAYEQSFAERFVYE